MQLQNKTTKQVFLLI